MQDLGPLPSEHGLMFAMDPGEQGTLLQGVDSVSGVARWTFSAPNPLLPATIHTITASAELHAADVREVSLDNLSGDFAVVESLD